MAEIGMPIYADIERHLLDPVGVDDAKHHWSPSNSAAGKLFRCVECLRDVREQIEHIANAKVKDKQKRRAKMLTTPLHSLAVCVRDLLNDCSSNPDTVKSMPADAHKLLPAMLAALTRHVPVGKDRLLSQVRDKTAAHVDKSIRPFQARELIRKLELHDLGLWLDVSIGILCELLKLPIYSWGCESLEANVIRVMMCEPFLVTMRVEDEQVVELMGVHMVARSPKRDVSDLIIEIVNDSRFMFRPNDPQIKGWVKGPLSETWANTVECFSHLGEAVEEKPTATT